MGWLGAGSHRGQGRQAWMAVGLPPQYPSWFLTEVCVPVGQTGYDLYDMIVLYWWCSHGRPHGVAQQRIERTGVVLGWSPVFCTHVTLNCDDMRPPANTEADVLSRNDFKMLTNERIRPGQPSLDKTNQAKVIDNFSKA